MQQIFHRHTAISGRPTRKLINIFPAIAIIFLKIEEVIFGFGFAFVGGFFGKAEQAPEAIHTTSEDFGIFFRNDIVERDDIVVEVNATPLIVVFVTDLRET